MDQTRPCTLGAATPPRADPLDVSLADSEYANQDDIASVPEAYTTTKQGSRLHPPLLYGLSAGPVCRLGSGPQFDNPLIRKRERTSGFAGAPSQAPMCITRYLRAMAQATAHLTTRIPTLE